jgi:hypothetical protein
MIIAVCVPPRAFRNPKGTVFRMFSLSATAGVTFATVLPSQYTLVGLRFDRVLLGKLGTQKLQHYGPRPFLDGPPEVALVMGFVSRSPQSLQWIEEGRVSE